MEDKLSKKDLRAEYGWTKAQLRLGDGELLELFDKAWQEEWGKERFEQELEQTTWWKQNNASARTYLLAKAKGGADFAELVDDATEAVRQRVMEIGYATLPDDLMSDIVDVYLSKGMGQPGQEYELQQYLYDLDQKGLLGAPDQYGGNIEQNAQLLRQVANANGVEFNDGYFISAGKSIASGLTQSQFWVDKIRKDAAATFPVFSDQIMLGANVQDIASPYISMMANVLELNPATISLKDPTILSALTGYDDKGNPYATDLGAFQRQLRRDPRWMDTNEAQNSITSTAGSVLQMFGMMGR